MVNLGFGHYWLDFAWLFLLLSLFGHFWRIKANFKKAQIWPKVDARVIHCEWEQKGNQYWPDLQYSYHVDQQEFIGDNLFLENKLLLPYQKEARLIAYQAVKAFKEQQDISIYYNPENPNQAAFNVQTPKKLYWILCVLGILTGLQIAFIFFQYWK